MSNKDQIIKSLYEKIQELQKIIEVQKVTIQKLQERINQLESQLKLNSRTSSKPPSSDGFKKANRTKSLRTKSKNPSGGQKGHKGHTLKQVKNPDIINIHRLNCCPNCKENITNTPVKSIKKRQVVDIPLIQTIVTEHQSITKYCTNCKTKVSAPFPVEVTAPVQYGKNIKALAIYLQHQQLLPQKRLQNLFSTLFNIPISAGTIAQISNEFSSKVDSFLINLQSQLGQAPVKHMDETGFRIKGKTQWLHVLSNRDATYYQHSPKRGALFETKTGTVVHDHFRTYYKRLPKVKHALCNAHHLRELKALIEIEKEPWAKKMYKLLNKANRMKQKYKHAIPLKKVIEISQQYNLLVEEGLSFHQAKPSLFRSKRGQQKRRKGHNLLIRLQKNKEDTLRFLYQKEVPFTNNQAEQDIRMMKVKQKISGCFRSLEGATVFCRIRSFLSTVRKQSLNILASIKKAFQGTFFASKIHPFSKVPE